MTDKDIGSATAGVDAKPAFSVDTATTDAPSGDKESTWINDKWTEYFGYYTDIPEVGTVIDTKATWTVGKGFTADEETTMLLDTIKGNGFDTFNIILENMIRTYHIGGDAYAEKVYDDEDNLINIKPLDPEVMRHHANAQGIITHFEQLSKTPGKAPKKLTPDKIFYLARNRVADQMHGTSMIKRLAKIILARNEAMEDWQRVLHLNVEPMLLIKLSTDNEAKIAEIKRKVDLARSQSQSVFYIPMGSMEIENITVAPNATMNPLSTIEMYNNLFYQEARVPQVIVGGIGAITERATSIAYLAWQQTIEEAQLEVEEQVLSQLNLVIKLTFPASLLNDLLSNKEKDGAENIDQSETTATEERA